MEPTAKDNQPVGEHVPGQHQEAIMGTPCAIGMKLADGSVKAIRCNFDGYPAGAGATLAGWYTQPEYVEKLLELGDLSSLGETIDDCVAYQRDRGEELNPAVGFESVEDFRLTGNDIMCADFLYIFEDGQWSTFGLKGVDEWIRFNVIVHKRLSDFCGKT